MSGYGMDFAGREELSSSTDSIIFVQPISDQDTFEQGHFPKQEERVFLCVSHKHSRSMGSLPKKTRSVFQLVVTTCIFVGHFLFGYYESRESTPAQPRQLAATVDDLSVGCPDAPGMFDMVDSAVSFKVVSCFLGIIVFQLSCEHLLEYLEQAAHGTVYAAVLHKTYRELMLLGFVAFIIFFILTGNDTITDSFVASFEYADFVMFFVGMSFIGQSIWTCIANYSVKAFVFKACNMKTSDLVSRHKSSLGAAILPMFTFNHNAVRMQLFRHIFLSVYDLPDEFSFPHYFGVSLDALTADLVELLPSSYVFLCLLIMFCEYLVRHYPYSYEMMRHPSRRENIAEDKAIFLYGLMGFMIFVTYLVILYVCDKATSAIINHKFPKQMEEPTSSMGSKLNAALLSTTVNGGFRTSRSFAKLMLDVMPFIDENKNAGAEEIEELNRRRSEQVAKQLQKAKSYEVSESQAFDARGYSKRRSDLESSRHGESKDDDDDVSSDRPATTIRFESDPSEDRGRSQSQRPSSSRRRRTTQLARTVSKSVKASTVLAEDLIAKSRRTKEEKEADKLVQKTKRGAMRMAKHASRINSKHISGGARLFEIMGESNTWSNEHTQRINQVVRESVPGSSIKGIRRFIDVLRLVSNFYIAIFICTFITGSHIATNMAPLTRAGNIVGLLTVVFANVFLDPLVTFEYTTMRTMGVINPLLVGETIEHVAELDRMLQLLALKILVNYRTVDPAFDETTYIPSSAHLKEVIKTAFDDWDVRGDGYFTEETFADAMVTAGVILPAVKVTMLFRRLDSFQLNGQIDFDEFWSCLAPVVNRTVDEIQGNLQITEETNNLQDPITALDEVHKLRSEEARLLALEETDPEFEAQEEDADPLNGEIGELIQKASRNPLAARDLVRLRELVGDLAANANAHRYTKEANRTPKAPHHPSTTSPREGHLLPLPKTVNNVGVEATTVGMLGSGPNSLPRADAPVASVTLSVEDVASRRLDKFVKKEMSKPVDPNRSSASVLNSFSSFLPADPQSLWQGLGGIGTHMDTAKLVDGTELTKQQGGGNLAR